MSYHDWGASAYTHAHIFTGAPRLKYISKKKINDETIWVDDRSYDLYRFSMQCNETKKVCEMDLLYSWDDAEWLKSSAACGVEFPIELRQLGIYVAAAQSPFA